MQNTLKDTHKNLRCIEWHLNPPYEEDERILSDNFLFLNKRCNLKLYTGVDYEYYPKLYFECNGDLPFQSTAKFKLSVILDFKTVSINVISITSVNQEIWKYQQNYYIPKKPLTFELLFHSDCSSDSTYRKALSNITENISMRSLSEDFSKLMETELDHDVVMKCGERSIKAHKLVLSTRSDVFRAMLQSDMLEACTGIIEIHDIDVDYFQEFTRFLYTDEMPEITFEKAKALYKAGDKYDIRNLVLRCAEYLGENLCPESVFQCYALADDHSDEKLKEVVKAYLLEKKIYLQSEYWMDFYKNYPELALEVYKLSYENNTKT